ncbi:DUF4271 domain-containing protein [Bizionia sediminis]|uniref:DUF4271 domain-containing protein n=1 Tax=Bizionia sediminis TaxID=1737064 RepID=A0ABW5KRE6_9FLAO
MLRTVVSNDLFTILLVIGLALIALTKVLYTKRFQEFILVLGNSKYLKIYAKEQKFFNLFDVLLFLNFVFSVTIFGSLCYGYYNQSAQFSRPFLLNLAGLVTAFLIVKLLAERFIGVIFDIDFLIRTHIFQKMSYKNFLGLLIVPINALLLYSVSISQLTIIATCALILLVHIIGLLTTIKAYQNMIKQNIFYFILYLCALEIAPYFILYQIAIGS